MDGAVPAAVVESLRQDIHGERVISARRCDYCTGTFSIEAPVLYEVARYSDVDYFTDTLGIPETWIPDAARCTACTRTTIEPATEGVEELLIRIGVTETRGLLRLDASELEIIEYSPSSTGYEAPPVQLNVLLDTGDPGAIRWQRLKHVYGMDAAPPEVRAALDQLLARVADPPELG